MYQPPTTELPERLLYNASSLPVQFYIAYNVDRRGIYW